MLVTATLLATPYAMVYDFCALTAVMAWRLFRPQPLGAVRTAIILVAWLMPVGAMYLNMFDLGLAPLALIARVCDRGRRCGRRGAVPALGPVRARSAAALTPPPRSQIRDPLSCGPKCPSYMTF